MIIKEGKTILGTVTSEFDSKSVGRLDLGNIGNPAPSDSEDIMGKNLIRDKISEINEMLNTSSFSSERNRPRTNIP